MTYLGYLKQAFLINILENYSNNIAKIIRTNKKLSILDNGIQNSLLKQKDIDNDLAGHIVEAMVDFDLRRKFVFCTILVIKYLVILLVE